MTLANNYVKSFEISGNTDIMHRVRYPPSLSRDNNSSGLNEAEASAAVELLSGVMRHN